MMMIGFSLTAEGLGFHIPKGYLYAAIGFSILIEVFNQVARKRRKKSLQGHRPLRARTAHAVLRLLGGQRLEADEVGEEVADLFEEGDDQVVFDRRERVMISGVLQLAEKPIRSLMTVRAEVDCIDLDSGREAIRAALLESSYSRLPLVRDGRVEEPLGYVHKKELLRSCSPAPSRTWKAWPASRSTCCRTARSSTPWSRCARPRPTWPSWSTSSASSSAC